MAFAPQSLTMANARGVRDAGTAAIRAGQTEFDLGQLETVDSAAVSVLLAWLRDARMAGKTLRYTNIPNPVHTLATLYGVDEFLCAAV